MLSLLVCWNRTYPVDDSLLKKLSTKRVLHGRLFLQDMRDGH